MTSFSNQRENVISRPLYWQTIDQKVQSLGQTCPNILVLYGEPHLTWELNRYLLQQLKRQPIITAQLNARAAAEYDFLSINEGLQKLREQLGLGGAGIDCSCFDIAYWLYWSLHNPLLPLSSAEVTQKMNRSDQFSTLADLVSSGSDSLVLAQSASQMGLTQLSPMLQELMPELLADLSEVAANTVPLGVFLAKLSWFLVRGQEKFRQWSKERGFRDLQELKECQDEYDILDRLPLFLARDIKQGLQAPDLEFDRYRAVIVVNGYEQLLRDSQTQCRWLDQMMSPTEASPKVLWIIIAEKQLAHLEHAERMPVLPLSEAECLEQLDAVGLDDPVIQQQILAVSQGNPLYLGTSIQTWQDLINQGQQPTVADIATTTADIFQKQNQTWTSYERQVWQLMAIPRRLDWSLLEQLIPQFLPEANQVPQELNELFNRIAASPLIEIGNAGWRMNPQMRSFLLQPELSNVQAIHQYLFEYYQQQVSDSLQPLSELGEATYHALKFADETAINWCLMQIEQQQEQFRHQELVSLLESIKQAETLSVSQQITVGSLLGRSYLSLHNWQLAVDVLEIVQEQREKLTVEPLPMTQDWFGLANAYWRLNRNFNANNACLEALSLLQSTLGTENPSVAEVLALQAGIVAERGKSAEAIELGRQSLQILEAHPDTTPVQLIQAKLAVAELYLESETPQLANDLAQEALSLADLRLGQQHYWSIKCQGFLAELLSRQEKWQQSLDLYQNAAQLAEQTLGCTHPQTLAYLQHQIRLLRQLDQSELADQLAEKYQGIVENEILAETIEKARLLRKEANSLTNIGKYGEAEPLYRQALNICRNELGDNHVDTAHVMRDLALLYREQGRYKEADLLYQRVLSIYQRNDKNSLSDTAFVLNALAVLYQYQAKYLDAEPLLKQALKIYKELPNKGKLCISNTLANLALLYKSQSRYNEAEPILKDALDISTRHLSNQHSDVANLKFHLADLYRGQGRYKEAEDLCKTAIKIDQSSLGMDHPKVAREMSLLAGIYDLQGRYKEAEYYCYEVLAIDKNRLGHNHPETTSTLARLARIKKMLGQYKESASLYFEVIENCQKEFGINSPSVAVELVGLGDLYIKQGLYEEAEKKIQLALNIYRSSPEDYRSDIATTLSTLASVYHYQSKYEEAEVFFKEAIINYKETVGEDHPYSLTNLNKLANLYRIQKRFSESEKIYIKVLDVRQEVLGYSHPDTVMSMHHLAMLYMSQERFNESETLFKQVFKINRDQLGEDHPNTVSVLNNFIYFYQIQERHEEAQALRQPTLETCQPGSDASSLDTAAKLENQAAQYMSQEQYSDAETLYRQALDIYKTELGDQHSRTQMCCWSLERAICCRDLEAIRQTMPPSVE